MSKIIDGKLVAVSIKERVAEEVLRLKTERIFPCLAVV